MANALTLAPHNNVRSAPAHRSRAARTTLPPAPMNRRQRQALHDLVHAPATTPGSRWARRSGADDLLWAGLLALLLAVCVLAPFEDLGYLRGAGAPAAPAQSSIDASRTM